MDKRKPDTVDVVVRASSCVYHGHTYAKNETIPMDKHDVSSAVDREQIRIKKAATPKKAATTADPEAVAKKKAAAKKKKAAAAKKRKATAAKKEAKGSDGKEGDGKEDPKGSRPE